MKVEIVKVKIVNAEALVVAPDEVLIVKLPTGLLAPEQLDGFTDQLDALLGDRGWLVIENDDVEFTKVQKEGSG